MTEIGYWLLGVVVAMFGIGQGMLFQGKVLLGEDAKKMGKRLKIYGWIWIWMSAAYLIAYTIIWQIIPRFCTQ